jgi:hypothetical protein
MKRQNVLGWGLILLAVLSLIFGWPWGSLVGAILALAGVLALRLQLSQAVPATQSLSTPQPSQQNTVDDPELLAALIKEMERRGEAVPEELISRARSAVETGLEDCFQKYEALVSNSSNKVVDLAAFAQSIRAQHGWPSQGSVLACEAPSEEMDFVLSRIEHFGGKVPFRESIFMLSMLEDGPEARYLRERQKRGYPSLFENEPSLEWSSDPGFYERQLVE